MEESILVGDFNVCYRSEGEGEPLVLLHGMSFSHEVWDMTIKEASRLFTVYAPPGIERRMVEAHLETLRENVQLAAPGAQVESAGVFGAGASRPE